MNYVIEPIRPEHDYAICKIIKGVGADFGAVGEGFGPGDAEVMHMSRHYGRSGQSQYYVALLDGDVVGGCGISPFNGSLEICELRKLFLLPEARGRGIGKELTLICLAFAKTAGFRRCYLDTLKGMEAAIGMYQKLGFKLLGAPLSGSVHSSCDTWMIKEL